MQCASVTAEAVLWSSIPGHRAVDAAYISHEAFSRIVTRAPGTSLQLRGLAQEELQYCPRDEPPAPAIFGRQLPSLREFGRVGDLPDLCWTELPDLQLQLQLYYPRSGPMGDEIGSASLF